MGVVQTVQAERMKKFVVQAPASEFSTQCPYPLGAEDGLENHRGGSGRVQLARHHTLGYPAFKGRHRRVDEAAPRDP